MDRLRLIENIFKKKPELYKVKGAMQIGTSSWNSDGVKLGESRGVVRNDNSERANVVATGQELRTQDCS